MFSITTTTPNSVDQFQVEDVDIEKMGIKIKGIEKKADNDDVLRAMARAFATEIPEGAFSAAEIQGFLLKRKRQPGTAVDEIKDWVENRGVR